jgi:uncharacterized membrane protein YqhA
MFRRLTGTSRFIILLAVGALFIGSAILLIMATLTILHIAWHEIVDFDLATSFEERHLDRIGVQLIGTTDMILIGTVLYIISLGLYQLFIDRRVPVPRWLQVHDLTDLKRDLISVTVVLLGVSFLGQVVEWQGSSNILPFGAAIALVVVGLGFILWLTPEKLGEHDESDTQSRSSPPQPSLTSQSPAPVEPVAGEMHQEWG